LMHITVEYPTYTIIFHVNSKRRAVIHYRV
jgi:hypothetical protein